LARLSFVRDEFAGFEARAEPTNASVENIRRIASDDMQLGFTQADAAADAVVGRAAFASLEEGLAKGLGANDIGALLKLREEQVGVRVRLPGR